MLHSWSKLHVTNKTAEILTSASVTGTDNHTWVDGKRRILWRQILAILISITYFYHLKTKLGRNSVGIGCDAYIAHNSFITVVNIKAIDVEIFKQFM